MNIGVIGLGSIGGLFSGFLAEDGHTVYGFDVDNALVETINQDGLHIRGGDDDIHADITATTDPSRIDVTLDIVFILVKSQDTATAIESHRELITGDTAVVTVQNGLSNMELLREYIPDEQVYGGYTSNGANMTNFGQVRILGKGTTVIGGADYETAERIANTISAAGLPTKPVTDPVPHIWDKQFISVGVKPIAALSELRHGPMSESDAAVECVDGLVNEAIAVAEAKGIEILSDDPISNTLDVINDPEKYDKMSSILEDIRNEQPTEIKYINGAIVKYGHEVDIETPMNQLATNLILAKQQSYL